MNNTATNTATCPTVRKQIGKTTYIVRVHFSETAKETMEDKIKRIPLNSFGNSPPRLMKLKFLSASASTSFARDL